MEKLRCTCIFFIVLPFFGLDNIRVARLTHGVVVGLEVSRLWNLGAMVCICSRHLWHSFKVLQNHGKLLGGSKVVSGVEDPSFKYLECFSVATISYYSRNARPLDAFRYLIGGVNMKEALPLRIPHRV